MKEPTREQILERMAENIIDEYVDEDSVVGLPFDYFYVNAEHELIKELNKPILTKKQKEHLAEDIAYLALASRHKYEHVRFMGADGLGEVRFYYINHMGTERHDTIAGKPCYTQNMDIGRIYTVEELLA